MPKLGDGQGPRGTFVNAIVGLLHDPRWQAVETLLHYRHHRRHHVDSGDCYLVEGAEAVAVFHRQLGGDAGIVIGIPAKEDHLYRLSGQLIIGSTQLHHLSLCGVELLLDG
jgi:hypothetical protein